MLLLGRVDQAEGKNTEAIEQLDSALSDDKDGSIHY